MITVKQVKTRKEQREFVKFPLKLYKNEVIDFALIGVVPEYRMKGVASILLYEAMKLLSSGTIKYAETNLNLEDNHAIQNQWKSFESEIHKRRRSFVKKI